jgi:WD40 repeat protein
LIAEIERLLPAVRPDPTVLGLEEWRLCRDAVHRLRTTLLELLKFVPAGADAIPPEVLSPEDERDREARPERYRRTWMEGLLAQQNAMTERIVMDLPRISALEAQAGPRRKIRSKASLTRHGPALPLTWIAASPDGTCLGIGSETGRFMIFSLRHSAVAHAFEAGGFVVRARWTPDGRRLLVGTIDGRLWVRGGDGREALGQIKTGHGTLRGLAVHPRGLRWATCGEDFAVRVWNPETLGLDFELQDGKAAAIDVGFAEGSIVAGYEDGFFVAWTEAGKEKLATGQILPDGGVYSLGVHPSGRSIVFGGRRGGMQEVVVGPPGEWRPGTRWPDTPPRSIAVNAIDFSSEGRMVGAFSENSATLFSSLSDGVGTPLGRPFYLRTPKPEWNKSFIVSGACFIPESPLVATCSFDGALRLWQEGRCVETIFPT